MKAKNAVVYIIVAMAGIGVGFLIAHMGGQGPGGTVSPGQQPGVTSGGGQFPEGPGISGDAGSQSGSEGKGQGTSDVRSTWQEGTSMGQKPPDQSGGSSSFSAQQPAPRDGESTPTDQEEQIFSKPDFVYGKLDKDTALSNEQKNYLNQLLTLQSYLLDEEKIYNFEQVLGRKWTGSTIYTPLGLAVIKPAIFKSLQSGISEGFPEEKYGKLKSLYQGALKFFCRVEGALRYHQDLVNRSIVAPDKIHGVYNKYRDGLLKIDSIYHTLLPSLNDPIRFLLVREMLISHYLDVFDRLHREGKIILNELPRDWDRKAHGNSFDIAGQRKSMNVFEVGDMVFQIGDISADPLPDLDIISSSLNLDRDVKQQAEATQKGSHLKLVEFLDSIKDKTARQKILNALLFGLAVTQSADKAKDQVVPGNTKMDTMIRLFKNFTDELVLQSREYLAKYPLIPWIPFNEIMGFGLFDNKIIYPKEIQPRVILSEMTRVRLIVSTLSEKDLGFNRLVRGFFESRTFPSEIDTALPILDSDPIQSLISQRIESIETPSLEIPVPQEFDHRKYKKRFYEEHKEFFNIGPQVKIRAIFHRDKKVVEQAKKALMMGEFFEVVAAQYSEIWQPRETLRLYPVSYFDEAISKVLETMDTTDISPIIPIAIPKGFVIIKALEKEPAKVLPQDSRYANAIPMIYFLEYWKEEYPQVNLIYEGVKEYADLLEKMSDQL